jgi:hypothetical protein
LEDPDKYPKKRYEKCGQKHNGKCIDVIYGIVSPKKSEIQALRYPKEIWTASDARSHCSSKGGSFEAATGKVKQDDLIDQHSGYPNDLTVRNYQVKFDTINEKERSVEAVLATEERVLVLDLSGWQVVEEILLMSGRKGPDKIPLLDSHDRSTIQKQLGSVRDFRIEGNKLIGRKYFSKSSVAEHSWLLTKEGHSGDNSIGYRVVNPVMIEPGQEDEVNGKKYKASDKYALRIVTEWELKEASVVAVGADKCAINRNQKVIDGRDTKMPDVEKQTTDILDIERERIDQLKKLAGDDVPVDVVERAITEGLTIESAKPIFLKALRSARPMVGSGPGESITVGRDLNRDSLPAALSDALCHRAGIDLIKVDVNGAPVLDNSGKAQKREPHAWAVQFSNLRLADLARVCLKESGVEDAWQMSDRLVIRKAITADQFTGHRFHDRGFASTISLPEILGSTLGRSLLQSYIEYPKMWPLFAKKTTAPDFRGITRVRLGEIENLKQIPEGGEFPYATIGENKEKYRLSKYGEIFGLTFESLLNDDLKALTEIPRKLAQAAVRKEDVLVFAILTANAAMDDTVLLFHATHGNLAAAGTALSVAALNAMKLAFRKQVNKAAGGDNVLLNLEPKVLIVPAALEGISKKLLESEFDPDDVAGKTANIWQNALELAVHPLLDTASATAWYISAAPVEGGIEICFLESEQTPALEQERGFENDTLRYRVRHVCAAKSIDFRALYKNPGA